MDERRQLPPNDKRKGKNNIRKIPNDYQRKNIVRKVPVKKNNKIKKNLLYITGKKKSISMKKIEKKRSQEER